MGCAIGADGRGPAPTGARVEKGELAVSEARQHGPHSVLTALARGVGVSSVSDPRYSQPYDPVVHQPRAELRHHRVADGRDERPVKKRTNKRPTAYIGAPYAVLLREALMLDSGRNVSPAWSLRGHR